MVQVISEYPLWSISVKPSDVLRAETKQKQCREMRLERRGILQVISSIKVITDFSKTNNLYSSVSTVWNKMTQVVKCVQWNRRVH